MASCDQADLLAGDRVRMARGRLGRVDPEAAGMWATGWLVADDQSVADVLLEFNRYRKRPVRFDPVELADVRVSSSFQLTDPDRALVGILQSTGLRLSRSGGGDLLVYRPK